MDRYTFYVLEFLEEINPASQTNMNDLVSIPFTWFQHVGVLALVWCVQSLLPRIPGVLSLHHGVAFSTVLNLPFFFLLVSSSFKNLQNYAYLFVWVCIYVCMYMHVCAYVYICVHMCMYRGQSTVWGSQAVSFCHVGPGEGTEVIRFGGMCPYLLGHLVVSQCAR